MSWYLILLLFWGVSGPLFAVSLLDLLELWPFYQERCHKLRWIPLFVAGPLAWIAALTRICRSDLIRYWQRQAARELIQDVRESCGKGKLGDVTFKDGRLVERHMLAFHPRWLDKAKPYFWDLTEDGEARMTVGDHTIEDQVTSFVCTRGTIINQMRSALSRNAVLEVARWSAGLELLNSERMGHYQQRKENGQYVWAESGKGLGWCRSCNLKLRHCECREIELVGA